MDGSTAVLVLLVAPAVAGAVVGFIGGHRLRHPPLLAWGVTLLAFILCVFGSPFLVRDACAVDSTNECYDGASVLVVPAILLVLSLHVFLWPVYARRTRVAGAAREHHDA